MPDPTSVRELDLTPLPGKKYFNTDREWREEFIYFLLVDRFQDDTVRPIAMGEGRSGGIGTPDTFFGGNLKGITRNLRLHRWPRLHRHLAFPGLRKQRERVSRLRHQQLLSDRSA